MHDYSGLWFETFLRTIRPEQTAREIAFVERQLPLAEFANVLDVCCGEGRHAKRLAALGYRVVGMDRSREPIAAAIAARHPSIPSAERPNAGSVRFIQADMLAPPLVAAFDAVLIMWQSFGMHDERRNRSVLREMRGLLRDGGRLILDIYDRRFFESRLGVRESVRGGRLIRETKRLDPIRKRLHVELRYDGSNIIDRMDWRIYTPDEIMEVARSARLDARLCCADFDEHQPADASRPRMQIVLEAEA